MTEKNERLVEDETDLSCSVLLGVLELDLSPLLHADFVFGKRNDRVTLLVGHAGAIGRVANQAPSQA